MRQAPISRIDWLACSCAVLGGSHAKPYELLSCFVCARSLVCNMQLHMMLCMRTVRRQLHLLLPFLRIRSFGSKELLSRNFLISSYTVHRLKRESALLSF